MRLTSFNPDAQEELQGRELTWWLCFFIYCFLRWLYRAKGRQWVLRLYLEVVHTMPASREAKLLSAQDIRRFNRELKAGYFLPVRLETMAKELSSLCLSSGELVHGGILTQDQFNFFIQYLPLAGYSPTTILYVVERQEWDTKLQKTWGQGVMQQWLFNHLTLRVL